MRVEKDFKEFSGSLNKNSVRPHLKAGFDRPKETRGKKTGPGGYRETDQGLGPNHGLGASILPGSGTTYSD